MIICRIYAMLKRKGSGLMINFEWGGVHFSLVKCGAGVLTEAIPMHCHSQNSYELHFILSGQGTLLIDSGEYKMRAGNFFVTGFNVNHSQIPDQNDPVEDIYIYLQRKRAVQPDKEAKLFLETHFFYHQEFENACAAQIVREFKGSLPGREYAVAGLMINLLTRIARLYAPSDSVAKRQLENLNDMRFYIIENMFLYSRDFTLKELSQSSACASAKPSACLKNITAKPLGKRRGKISRTRLDAPFLRGFLLQSKAAVC